MRSLSRVRFTMQSPLTTGVPHEAPRPASAPAPRAGPARSTATRAPTYHSRPTLTTYWCRTHLASLVSLRSGMQVCEADATIRMATRVDTMVSGGMCVCEDAAARCPPKGTSCGDPITAPGTSPNYYRVATNGSLSPDPCRDVNRTTPCYDWCAQECEDDPLCSVWDFHDKGGGQCDLYNHTRMLREEDGQAWPEFAVGCSARAAQNASNFEACCVGVTPTPSPPPPPAVKCIPNANPPETCPSGVLCPNCGDPTCDCPQ